MHKTKIIATLGPSSQSQEQILNLIRAGVDVVRVNFSHGDRESHLALIDNVKAARAQANQKTAILLDTCGPEIRVGEMAEDVTLTEGTQFILTPDSIIGDAARATVNYPGLPQDLSPGDKLLLDDGKIAIQVVKIEDNEIYSQVLFGGRLTSRKRVSAPGININLPSLSSRDAEDITFGVTQEVDFIAASFIRSAEDVFAVRKVIEEAGGHQTIIAKIENRQGVENIAEIVDAADGLMVARGDLGVEMPAEEVPVIQKHLIKAANSKGKPAITATQMLESMIVQPSPTRAEASDVTNAIYDGTDAVMLSAETAVGKYPVEAVEFLVRNASISEGSLDYEEILARGLRHRRAIVTDAISYASCAIAADLQATAIITATNSGSTARRVARYRPKPLIIAVSPNEKSLRQLQLVRGVIPLACPQGTTMNDQLSRALKATTEAELIANGDLVVFTAGMPIGTSGSTNMIKVHTVADAILSGQGVGNETVSGTVRIVNTMDDLKDLPEEPIIVLAATDESMALQLASVRGIIAEQPGLTSHAAIIGLQYDIPVVCGIDQATRRLKNGQKVNLDANTGHISYGVEPR